MRSTKKGIYILRHMVKNDENWFENGHLFQPDGFLGHIPQYKCKICGIYRSGLGLDSSSGYYLLSHLSTYKHINGASIYTGINTQKELDNITCTEMQIKNIIE